MATLTSEIERKKQEIENKFLEATFSLPNLDALEQELIVLEGKLNETEVLAAAPINNSLVNRIFNRREYKKSVASKKDASEEIWVLREDIRKLKISIIQTRRAHEQCKESKEVALARIEGAKNPVEELLKQDPSLLGDLEFLKSCIDYDLANIVLGSRLDEKEKDELFAYFAECYKGIHFDEEELKKIGYSEEKIQELHGSIDYVISELRDPKTVEEGKYKIPHRYLRGSIINQYASFDPSTKGKSFSCLGDVVNGATKNLIEFDFFEHIASRYARFDGSISEEYGKSLEEICDDPTCYIYMHYVSYKGDLSDEKIPTCESICEKGLRLPLAGNEFGNPSYTTLNTNNDRYMTVLDFMEYWALDAGVVALKVPKDIVDNAEPYIGWFYNEYDGYQIEETYMLPEYVIGYTHDGKFVKNPIPLEQRQTKGIDRFYKVTADANSIDINAQRTIKLG